MRIHTEIDLGLNEDDKEEEEASLIGFESLEMVDFFFKKKHLRESWKRTT